MRDRVLVISALICSIVFGAVIVIGLYFGSKLASDWCNSVQGVMVDGNCIRNDVIVKPPIR